MFTASGAIGLLPGTEGEFRAEGTSALSFLQTFAPGIAGEAAFQLHIAGPPEARRTAGKIDLNDLSLIETQQQWALAGLSGTVTLDADVLETQGLRGQLNGGDVTIAGAISIRPGVVAPRPLTIEGRGLFVEIPKGLRSQLDASVTWENAAAGSRLSGQISIAADTYREPITALAALLAETAPGRTRALPPWIADTALDIRLNSVGPLVVDQSVLWVELVPDVQLTGTVGSPALKGQVAIHEDGRVRAGGRSYRLTESRLDFSPDAGLIPRLNVIGETRVGSYLVTLRMTGPADEIETNFSSDPPLSERDVRSLLVTGQTADPARGSNESDRFAVGAVSGDMLGIAGQFVGLDSVQVGTEDLDLVSRDVNPATRLTVSKRLRNRFELVLSENLEESQSTWIIIYRPVIGYEFRLSSEENTKEAIEFRQEITFGPGVSTRARARSTTVAEDRIRAVTLTGDPGFPTGEVLSVTKVDAGDRFEFREWLSDRGRIERFYWDRGTTPPASCRCGRRPKAPARNDSSICSTESRAEAGHSWKCRGTRRATISSNACDRRGPRTSCSTCWTTASPRWRAITSSTTGFSAHESRSRSIGPSLKSSALAFASTPACARALAGSHSAATASSHPRRCRSSRRLVSSTPKPGRTRPR